jgi:GT2 family glycosyltransferase
MKLAIIIVNYNTPADTLECLASLKVAKLPRNLKVETTVVDNASRDDSVHQFEEKYPEVKLVQNPANLGFAGGNNAGIKAALEEKPDWLMLLNSDTVVPKSFFLDLASAVKKCDFDICSPLIYFAAGHEFHKKRYKGKELGKVVWYGGGEIDWDNVYGSHANVDAVDLGQFKDCQPTDFATGACLLAKRKVWEKVGLLNEDYFLYLEDLEFCQRARLGGFSIGFNPHFSLWHKVSVSTGGIGSDLNDYFITRNRLVFGTKYAPTRTRVALLREALGKLSHGTAAQKQAVKDFLFHRLGKGKWLV